MGKTISEINLWLKESLEQQSLKDISVKLEGNSAKGDGYAGDIVFVQVSAVDAATQQEKQLDLVLKCSKINENLRDDYSMQRVFLNEIFLYEKLLPTFAKFQLSRNVKSSFLFNSYPKFYGKYTNDSKEVVILENLKSSSYVLWPRDVTLPINNLLMVVREYGKFHAISVAMQDQQPLEFENLTKNMTDFLRKIFVNTSFGSIFLNLFDETYKLFQGILSNDMLENWLSKKNKINDIYYEMREAKNDLKVVLHGDCWNNNFMWKLYEDKSAEKVAIIDWQISFVSSPILDLTYFLFSCITPDDIANLDIVLNCYYESFAAALNEMKSDAKKLYPKQQFEKDWKKYSCFGILQGIFAAKLALTEDSDIPDLDDFLNPNKDKPSAATETKLLRIDEYKARIMPIIKYAIDNKLFD